MASVTACRGPVLTLIMLLVAHACFLNVPNGIVVYAETPMDEQIDFSGDDDKTNVVELEEEEFSEYIASNSPVLVMFYSPQCGFCQKMKPDFENAAIELSKLGAAGKLAKVDGTENRELISKHGIQGYPSLKLFQDSNVIEYRGGRTSEEIVKWFLRLTGPAVRQINKLEEASAEEMDVFFVGYFSSKDTPLYLKYLASANDLRSSSIFYAVVSPTENNSITAYKTQEDDVTFKGEIDELKEFLTLESFPILVPLHPGNFEIYFKRGLDFVWFDSVEDYYKEFGDIIRSVARAYRGKYTFVWVDSSKYAPSGEGEGPRFMVNRMNGSRYALENPITSLKDPENLHRFLTSVENGEVPVFLKSEAIPVENEEPVKVVVGKTLKEIMYQTENDVMLEVYAPWCGHCKEFEPSYIQFAEKMKGKNLLVAKMDGTANESPDSNFEWKGFPTIFFMKAGAEKPVLYEGDRNVRDLTKFVTEHGTRSSSVGEEL
ncbi:protein disulfide isomerase [Cardiosporidium cionae]|uniref:protein disulfide-isomerase n=1 Tax=Cardiosporidium cionae TaxID=476202 RepID=A0ABQ7J561_9APIC|nr:protein disulfide isomerase [Cardiosporidium cionae]|eukprot:KAF8819132.1 protein disulfide isomerase [Cardiosporidium cionae]